MKETLHRVNLYTGIDEQTELEVVYTFNELLDRFKEQNLDILPVCDFCNKLDTHYSFFPELGFKLECQECAKSHKAHVKWYQEDMHIIFNCLISWVISYPNDWTEYDYLLIDKYFSENSNRHISIKDFLEGGGK